MPSGRSSALGSAPSRHSMVALVATAARLAGREKPDALAALRMSDVGVDCAAILRRRRPRGALRRSRGTCVHGTRRDVVGVDVAVGRALGSGPPPCPQIRRIRSGRCGWAGAGEDANARIILSAGVAPGQSCGRYPIPQNTRFARCAHLRRTARRNAAGSGATRGRAGDRLLAAGRSSAGLHTTRVHPAHPQ